MSYYLLPKKNIELNIKINYTNDPPTPYVSHSLYYYLNHIESVFSREKEKEKEKEKESRMPTTEQPMALNRFIQDSTLYQEPESLNQPFFESCVFSLLTTPGSSPYDSTDHFDELSRIHMDRKQSLEIDICDTSCNTYPPGIPIHLEQNITGNLPLSLLFPESGLALNKNFTKSFSKTMAKTMMTKSLTHMIDELNTYEFIFSKVPNSNLSVSKLKPYSNTFYIYMEIFQMFRFLDLFENVNIKTMHVGKNNHAIIECLNIIREDSEDIHESHLSCFTIHEEKGRNDYQLLSYELMACDEEDRNNVFEMGRNVLIHLLRNQASNGICIIKIRDVYHKPILDILYIVTTLYEKVYIIKPNHSNIFKSERFIICKNFILNTKRQYLYDKYCKELSELSETFEQNMNEDCEPFFSVNELNELKRRKNRTYISSFIQNDLPYYFLCKIEESNIIIGHQQLDNMDHLFSLYKGKNNEEKIEMIKKNNIQKCIQWCDKYKIPHNKFIEKVNIFITGSS